MSPSPSCLPCTPPRPTQLRGLVSQASSESPTSQSLPPPPESKRGRSPSPPPDAACNASVAGWPMAAPSPGQLAGPPLSPASPGSSLRPPPARFPPSFWPSALLLGALLLPLAAPGPPSSSLHQVTGPAPEASSRQRLRPPPAPSWCHTVPSRLGRPVSPAPGTRPSSSAVPGRGGRPRFSCSFLGLLLLLGFLPDSQAPEQRCVAVFSNSLARDSVCPLRRRLCGGRASCWGRGERSVSTACSVASACRRAGVRRPSERSRSTAPAASSETGRAHRVPACPLAPFLCRWCRQRVHSPTLLLDPAQERPPTGSG